MVLTGSGRIREFVEMAIEPRIQRALQARKITGIPLSWWRDHWGMGEFLGKGFGRLWYAEYPEPEKK